MTLSAIGAGGSVDPLVLPGCVGDWNALAETFNDGDAVGTFTDRSPGVSGTPRNLTQATAASKPTFKTGANGINGRPAVSFDGGDWMDYTTSFGNIANITAVSVMRTGGSVSGAQNVFTGLDNANTAGIKVFLVDAGFSEIYAGTQVNGAAMTINTNYYIVATFNGSSSSLLVNTSLSTPVNPGTGNIAHWCMGRNAFNNSQFYNGLVGRVSIFNRILTSLEVNMLLLGIHRTWGI